MSLMERSSSFWISFLASLKLRRPRPAERAMPGSLSAPKSRSTAVSTTRISPPPRSARKRRIALGIIKRYAGNYFTGVSFVDFSRSSLISLVASLNSRIPRPRPLASSGMRFAPKRSRITTRIRINEPPPMFWINASVLVSTMFLKF